MREQESLRIGVFGGTFDPIHWGHLALAIDLAEAHRLDEVWVMPSSANPHKDENPATDAAHRLNMVEIAVKDVPRLVCSDLEVVRGGTSYTIDTLRALDATRTTSARQFFLLLGDDAAGSLPKWHEPEKIVQMVPLLVGRRQVKFDITALQGYPSIFKAVQKGLTPTSLLEISATQIRERIRKGLYCGHLVPGPVLEYIKQHRLYV